MGLMYGFVEHKNEALTLRFAPAYLSLYQSATPSLVMLIEHDTMTSASSTTCAAALQHVDVVSPLLFLRLVGTGNCRCRVGWDR
jgi:hypothetical protein